MLNGRSGFWLRFHIAVCLLLSALANDAVAWVVTNQSQLPGLRLTWSNLVVVPVGGMVMYSTNDAEYWLGTHGLHMSDASSAIQWANPSAGQCEATVLYAGSGGATGLNLVVQFFLPTNFVYGQGPGALGYPSYQVGPAPLPVVVTNWTGPDPYWGAAIMDSGWSSFPGDWAVNQSQIVIGGQVCGLPTFPTYQTMIGATNGVINSGNFPLSTFNTFDGTNWVLSDLGMLFVQGTYVPSASGTVDVSDAHLDVNYTLWRYTEADDSVSGFNVASSFENVSNIWVSYYPQDFSELSVWEGSGYRGGAAHLWLTNTLGLGGGE